MTRSLLIIINMTGLANLHKTIHLSEKRNTIFGKIKWSIYYIAILYVILDTYQPT